MAFGSALVDKARLVRQTTSGTKVEGTTQYVDHEGEWFKARLELPNAPEGQVNPSRKRVVVKPTLLTKTRDLAGEPIEFRASDRIEVESKQFGNTLWEAAGDPQPLRKRRTLLGWQLEMRRVDDNEADRI